MGNLFHLKKVFMKNSLNVKLMDYMFKLLGQYRHETKLIFFNPILKQE